MTKQLTRTLHVKDYEDFRDSLPTSGVFDMTDCAVEIWCPELAEAVEVERMVHLIESMLHVTDVRVTSSIEDMLSDEYRVVVTQEPSKRQIKKRSER